MVVVAEGRYELPDDFYYSNQHVYIDMAKMIIGLDDIGYAFLKNPTELQILADQQISIGEPIAAITTDRGITTLLSPVTGKIKAVNENALDFIKTDTYSKGFLIEMENIDEFDSNLVKGKDNVEKWAKLESKILLRGEYVFKVIEIGDGTVGKTAVKVRFTDNYFKKDLKSTLGVDFGTKTLQCEIPSDDLFLFGYHRFKARMNVWDAAGQAHFEKMRKMYYRATKGALLIYDVSNPITFQHLDGWIEEIETNIGEKIPILLIGNKIDLPRKISKEEAQTYAKSKGMLYFECSAKTGEGVTEAFKELAIEIYKKEENL